MCVYREMCVHMCKYTYCTDDTVTPCHAWLGCTVLSETTDGFDATPLLSPHVAAPKLQLRKFDPTNTPLGAYGRTGWARSHTSQRVRRPAEGVNVWLGPETP